MKIAEILTRIQSLYSKGVSSDDTRLEDRYIYNKAVTVRSKLISQEANKKQKINQWNYQTLNCVELIEAEKHECPCIVGYGCTILRSKYKIPKPLTGLNAHLIQSVSTIDGSITFAETTWNVKKYKKGSKYTSNKPDYYIRNGYLYLTVNKSIALISITYLLDDPLEGYIFDSYCKNESCLECIDCESYLEKEFPISNDLLDTLIDMCKEELISQFSQMIEDKTNNTSDSLIEQSK